MRRGPPLRHGFCVREDQFPIPIPGLSADLAALDLAPEQSQFEPALLGGDKFCLSARRSARRSVKRDGVALGYEDLNDHDHLRHDPMMAVLAGKLTARREDSAPVAGNALRSRTGDRAI
jgi:hypothetical protein